MTALLTLPLRMVLAAVAAPRHALDAALLPTDNLAFMAACLGTPGDVVINLTGDAA